MLGGIAWCEKKVELLPSTSSTDSPEKLFMPNLTLTEQCWTFYSNQRDRFVTSDLNVVRIEVLKRSVIGDGPVVFVILHSFVFVQCHSFVSVLYVLYG